MTTKDQRAYPRVPLVLSGVVAVADLRYSAVVTDISAGGTGLQYLGDCPTGGMIGQIDIPGFGCFDGITVRDGGDFRGFRFLNGDDERSALLSKLVRYIEGGLADPLTPPLPLSSQLSLVRLSGAKQNCDVESISINGIMLATDDKIQLGELVRMGHMYGRVSHHTTAGVAVRFLSFVAPPTSDPIATS